MSPFLSRPIRTYAEAAADVVANSKRYGIRLDDKRLALLEMIERELKRRERSYITDVAR